VIIVIAIDALEYNLVEEFESTTLKQTTYGKTDISEFSEPRTMVLWSSFMTGENKEKEVLAKGDKEMWNTRWPIEETFFSQFNNPAVLDLPGFSYDKKVHDRSRELLKKYFQSKDQSEKDDLKKQYNKDAFDHHRNIKEEFISAINEDHDFVLGYFSLADVIGHLNFGNKTMMGLIYKDLEGISAKASEKSDKIIILSDHGMFDLGGGFGDHSEYGFYSTSWESGIENPKITDFKDIILSIRT